MDDFNDFSSLRSWGFVSKAINPTQGVTERGSALHRQKVDTKAVHRRVTRLPNFTRFFHVADDEVCGEAKNGYSKRNNNL